MKSVYVAIFTGEDGRDYQVMGVYATKPSNMKIFENHFAMEPDDLSKEDINSLVHDTTVIEKVNFFQATKRGKHNIW